MARAAAGIAAAFVTFCIALLGQSADDRLRDANLAWDRGEYASALRTYLALIESISDESILRSIALQTGELFQTIELTSDGGNPRFSPTGAHFTYEVGRGVGRTTRLASSDSPTKVAGELPGYGAVFSPDGSEVAYLKLSATAEMRELERSADASSGVERTQRLAALSQLTETAARVTVRDVASGREREIEVGQRKNALLLANRGLLLFTSRVSDEVSQVYLAAAGSESKALTTGEPDRVLIEVNATGTAALFAERARAVRGRGTLPPTRFGIVNLPTGSVTMVTGSAPTFSPDGRSLAYVTRTDSHFQLVHAALTAPESPTVVRSGPERLDAPTWSPDAGRIAFQMMPLHDWDLFVIGREGSGERRLTRDIQHDVTPKFLGGERLLGLIGEPRHRRSYLYDLESARPIRLFHNNAVRTIAPEYAWIPDRTGSKLLIVAERDGDTVSAARGVYLMDLTRTVSAGDVKARISASLEAEDALLANSKALFAPIADSVRQVVSSASLSRVFEYQEDLFRFDSKHITRPGNRLAAEYLFATYKSFGYEPEYQRFAVRNALGGETANVLATLRGTVNPELVYVVSSHYDSIAEGPGADDNAAGTAALLETARILAKHPQPATIVFAAFTAEESGLLGSGEFVRRARTNNIQVTGAINNDVIGWANDHRLDGTIRYSNRGIRDVQHAAALQFTSLITYDALYFRGTDAQAYYEAYGDIVGGFAQYPVLANPHYHQAHDVLETINHRLVTEVVKMTTASVMLLASSPARVKGLEIQRVPDGTVTVSWSPSPEKSVTGYLVRWRPPASSEVQQLRVTATAATITAPTGTIVAVKPINEKGLAGWDWAIGEIR